MLHSSLRHSALVAVSLSICLCGPVVAQAPPAAAPAPAPAVPKFIPPATLQKLFNESEAAFAAKDYGTGVAKIQELLELLGPGKEAPYELMYFYIGLGNLLTDKFPEAEAAFRDCVRRYPSGEYASRCNLGIGRACMMQEGEEKKAQAIIALKAAAADPKYRSEAGLWLGQVYTELNRHEEALAVFRSLMGSDVRTPQQTTAAVEAVGLLADLGKLEDLSAYLDRLSYQPGVRDALAWFTNQMVVRGDELVGTESYEAALIIYRSIPARSQILDIQTTALAEMRKELKVFEDKVKAEANKPLGQRSNASELAGALKPAIELAEGALKAIEDKPDLDAALLMRRGRCLFYMGRNEEALTCFQALREKFPNSTDLEAASYAEIVILNKRQDIEGIKEKCDVFMRKFPESSRIEQIATLAGEVMVQNGKWKEVGSFYRGLETKFPKSEAMDRYVFFQALAFFMDANFKESSPLFDKFLKTYPNSELVESAYYYVAMSNFLQGVNRYKETLASCRAYLAKFPDGRYAGDMQYRLSFIDFNDKDVDQNDKIIRDLGNFLKNRPDDLSNGSMLCLMADTWKKKMDKAGNDQEIKRCEDAAIECYLKAVWTESPDDVVQYALDSATNMLQGRKDWKQIAEIHGKFLKTRPNSPLALLSATWVAKAFARDGKAAEAATLLADTLKARIADPACEQVEFLIDELVKAMVPRKKAKDLDVDALDKQLTDLLAKTVEGRENATTAARVYYARARLAQMVKRADRSDLYLKGIATTNAKDPSGLSAALLSVSGDILLKGGDLDGAEAMFRRLTDRYTDSMFSDAGPVGLGYVAMARKKPDEALKIFENVLENNAGTSRIKETMLGKLQALVELGKFEDAEKLGSEMVGDKLFRGEFAAKAYLLLGQVYRKQAATAGAETAAKKLAQAHGTYQRVYVAYQGYPELCSEAYWNAYEVLAELKEDAQAQETLKVLAKHPKLQNTARAKKAAEMTN
jgi:tetratricopeptide (TPR) repeat protein